MKIVLSFRIRNQTQDGFSRKKFRSAPESFLNISPGFKAAAKKKIRVFILNASIRLKPNENRSFVQIKKPNARPLQPKKIPISIKTISKICLGFKAAAKKKIRVFIPEARITLSLTRFPLSD